MQKKQVDSFFGKTREAIYRGAFLQTVALLHESGFRGGLGDIPLIFYEQLAIEFGKRNYDEVSKLIQERIKFLGK